MLRPVKSNILNGIYCSSLTRDRNKLFFHSVGNISSMTFCPLTGLRFADASSKYKGGELAGLSQKELKDELAGRLKKRVEEQLLGGKTADTLRLGIKGYRERYYQKLFGASPGEQ